jgi:hypothetical protein
LIATIALALGISNSVFALIFIRQIGYLIGVEENNAAMFQEIIKTMSLQDKVIETITKTKEELPNYETT